jgi:hypothetical protein
MLRLMDPAKADSVSITAQFDRAYAILRVRLATPNIIDQAGK